MARIRSIKPEFWSDLKLARLSRDARLFYVALWNQADEEARLHGDPRWIKGHCFPYDDDLTLAQINGLLEDLTNAGRVVRYVVADVPYLFLPKLDAHQRLEPKRVPSRLPAPSEDESQQTVTPSERGADLSVRRDNPSAREGFGNTPSPLTPTDGPLEGEVVDRESPSARGDNPSEPRADTSAQTVTQQHVAGSREHVTPTVPGADAPTTARTPNQRANELANGYCAQVPLSKHPAVAGIIRRAIDAGYPDSQIALALSRLIAANRVVTVDSLRVELEGPPKPAPSRNQQALGNAMARAAHAEATGQPFGELT